MAAVTATAPPTVMVGAVMTSVAMLLRLLWLPLRASAPWSTAPSSTRRCSLFKRQWRARRWSGIRRLQASRLLVRLPFCTDCGIGVGPRGVLPRPRLGTTLGLPTPPRSKGSAATRLLLDFINPAAPSSASPEASQALSLLAPASFVAELVPSRPPGFEVSPPHSSPPFLASGAISSSSSTSAGSPPDRGSGAMLAPLFAASQGGLLSPPPLRPCNRRKTLTGVTIIRQPVQRSSARIKARRKEAPVAQKAESLVCRNLGIKDGEVVTEQAMAAFSLLFKDQVPHQSMAAFRELFKLNSDEDEAVEDVLISQGGAAALDHEDDGEAAIDGRA